MFRNCLTFLLSIVERWTNHSPVLDIQESTDIVVLDLAHYETYVYDQTDRYMIGYLTHLGEDHVQALMDLNRDSDDTYIINGFAIQRADDYLRNPICYSDAYEFNVGLSKDLFAFYTKQLPCIEVQDLLTDRVYGFGTLHTALNHFGDSLVDVLALPANRGVINVTAAKSYVLPCTDERRVYRPAKSTIPWERYIELAIRHPAYLRSITTVDETEQLLTA